MRKWTLSEWAQEKNQGIRGKTQRTKVMLDVYWRGRGLWEGKKVAGPAIAGIMSETFKNREHAQDLNVPIDQWNPAVTNFSHWRRLNRGLFLNPEANLLCGYTPLYPLPLLLGSQKPAPTRKKAIPLPLTQRDEIILFTFSLANLHWLSILHQNASTSINATYAMMTTRAS